MARKAATSQPASTAPAATQIAGFLAKYDPPIAKEARAARTTLRRLMPSAVEMVYDNYNALVFGFGPTERASEAIVSIAVMPQWISLCFLQNASELPDPAHLLRGQGNVARHVRLTGAAHLDEPAVQALLAEALSRADVALRPGNGYTVIKSVSIKQRPRRPSRRANPRDRPSG